VRAGAQPFCRCNHVRVVFSPPYVTPCARVGLLLSDAPHRRGAVPASRTAARGRPPELYSRPLIGEMIGPRLIERMFSPQGVSPRFARPFPTAVALRPSQVKAFARRRSSAGWPPVCRTPSLRSPPAATCADWQPSPPPTSSPPLRVPFGYSEGPGTRTWTAVARASLLPEACRLVGIDRHIVVAHSWGVLVALALALDHPDGLQRRPRLRRVTAVGGNSDRSSGTAAAWRCCGQPPGILSGGLHMGHHFAPERVVRAIDAVAEAAASRPQLRE
jgi:hypothetical protein